MDHIFLITKIFFFSGESFTGKKQFFFQENLSLEENTDETNDERKKRKDETGIILLLQAEIYA